MLRSKYIPYFLFLMFIRCSICDEFYYFMEIPQPAQKVKILLFLKENNIGDIYGDRVISCRYRVLEKDGNFSEFGVKELGKCFIQNKGSVIYQNHIIYTWLTDQQLRLTIAPTEQQFLITVQGDSLKLEETITKTK